MVRASFFAAFLAGAVVVSCGGSEFSQGAGGGADADVDGSLPPPVDGGVGPDGAVGGEASSGDAISAGCPPCTDSQYCNTLTRQCTACSDLSRFEFGAPGVIVPVSNGPGKNQLFPRIGVTANGVGQMVYQYTDSGSPNTQLAATTSWTTMQGATLSGSINNGNVSGPLLLPPGSSVLGATADPGSGLLLFDSDNGGKISIWAASQGTSGGTIGALAGAINAGTSDSHIAVAAKAPNGGRVFWTSNRSIGPAVVLGLFTMPMTATGSGPVNVPLDLDNGCHCVDPDVQAWVTPDGTTLLFSCVAQDPAAGCGSALDQGHKHLYRASLDPATGLQQGMAIRLGINQLGGDDLTPSLTPSFCDLLFSSARRIQDFDILVAHRQ